MQAPAHPLLRPVAPAPWPIRTIGRTLDWAVILIGASMALLVFLNVVLRFFGQHLAWVTELGELLMVWVTFLGGACAAQRGVHMAITEFIDKLAPAARRWADVAVLGACAAMLGVLSRYGWSLVNSNWDNQLTVLEWPMAIQYMGMAVGSTLMLMFVAFDGWQALRGVPRSARYPADE